MADASLTADQRSVYIIYAMLTASIVFGLIPNIFCALPALILFCVTPVVAGRMRRTAAPDGIAASHMTLVIRTIWVASAIAAVTVTLASLYLISADNIMPLQPCVITMTNAMQSGAEPSPMMLNRCIGPFLTANMRVFWIAGAIAAAPVLLYMIWRLARGITLACKKLPVPNPQAWI